MTGIFLDLETGGLDPQRCGVTQIAAVAFSLSPTACDLHDSFDALISPEPELFFSPRALAVQGRALTDPALLGAQTEREVYESFSQWTRRHYGSGMWAHHAPFDEGFLAAVAGRTGLPAPLRGSVRCTKQLFQAMISAGVISAGDGKTSLKALARRFDLEQREPHDALSDAATGARVLWNLWKAARWSTLGAAASSAAACAGVGEGGGGLMTKAIAPDIIGEYSRFVESADNEEGRF